jgi:hypothetical protein
MPDDPHHDFAGLEQHLALIIPLENVLVTLDAYCTVHGPLLRESEREHLTQTIRSLCITIDAINNRA